MGIANVHYRIGGLPGEPGSWIRAKKRKGLTDAEPVPKVLKLHGRAIKRSQVACRSNDNHGILCSIATHKSIQKINECVIIFNVLSSS